MALSRTVSRFVFFILLSLSFITVSAGEGWVISKITTDIFGNKSYYTSFIGNNKVRNESAVSIVIIDIKKDSVTMIFPARHAYWTGTADNFKDQIRKALLKEMENFIAQIEEQDKEIYQKYFDELKEKLNTMDSLNKTTDIFFKPLKKQDSVRDFLAQPYYVYLDSVKTEKVWVTDSVRPFKNIDLEKLMQISAKLNPFDKEIIINNSESYDSLIKNSLVVKMEKYINGEVYSTTEVTNVRQGNIPEAFFVPPEGYKEVSIISIVDMNDSGMLPDLKTPFDKNNSDPFGNFK